MVAGCLRTRRWFAGNHCHRTGPGVGGGAIRVRLQGANQPVYVVGDNGRTGSPSTLHRNLSDGFETGSPPGVCYLAPVVSGSRLS